MRQDAGCRATKITASVGERMSIASTIGYKRLNVGRREERRGGVKMCY